MSEASGNQTGAGSASRQFGSSSKPLLGAEETDTKVKEQLDALEQQMAKLEGELEDTGVGGSTNLSQSGSSTDEEIVGSSGASHRPRRELGEEEATSELQAVDELLTRLEEKRAAGGVDDGTYERLRSKYLKRKNELKASD